MLRLINYFIAALYILLTFAKLSLAFKVYSNCYKSTNWTKTSGDELRSWLNSIVPSASPYSLEIQVMFSRNGVSDKPVKIYSNEIRWDIIGPHKVDGWIYGRTDKKGQFIKEKTYFIFPDFKTALIGTFHNDKLISGIETKVTHFRCIHGVMELKFSKPKPNAPIYRYVERSETIFSDNNLLRDPLERKNVYIGSSTEIPEIAHQDALFARKDIPPFSLVSYYGGNVHNKKDDMDTSNLTKDAQEDFHKNRMNLNQTHVIDIPPSMTSITKFRSTLGHKANHLFKGINTAYTPTRHPVYGQIMCLESTRYIKKGEEIIVSYNYNPHAPSTPRWYKKLFDESNPNQPSNPAQKCSSK